MKLSIEEHVEVISGEDEGKRGRISSVSLDGYYNVFIFDNRKTKMYSEKELKSLED